MVDVVDGITSGDLFETYNRISVSHVWIEKLRGAFHNKHSSHVWRAKLTSDMHSMDVSN